MNLTSGIEWVANLFRQWTQRDAQPDFGDMGTAFGLEATFSELMDADGAARGNSAPRLSEAAYAAGLAMR